MRGATFFYAGVIGAGAVVYVVVQALKAARDLFSKIQDPAPFFGAMLVMGIAILICISNKR